MSCGHKKFTFHFDDRGDMIHNDCGGWVGWFKDDDQGHGGYVCNCGAQGEEHDDCDNWVCEVAPPRDAAS